jgi:hypothetical protein
LKAAVTAAVKKGALFKGEESIEPFAGACPDIAQQFLSDPLWTRVFFPTLSHALYVSDQPFTDWIWGSSTLVQTVQDVFDLTFTNISYTLSAQDSVVRVVRMSCDLCRQLTDVP